MSDITPADQFFPKPCAQSDSLLKKAANWIGLADSLQLKPIPADLSTPELQQERQATHLKWDAARERFLVERSRVGPYLSHFPNRPKVYPRPVRTPFTGFRSRFPSSKSAVYK